MAPRQANVSHIADILQVHCIRSLSKQNQVKFCTLQSLFTKINLLHLITFAFLQFFFVFFLFRFIYVRHASRLLVDGVQMLHFVVTFFISLWISKRFFGLIWFGWIHEAPKMMFCTKNNISRLLAEDFAGYSVKPKIMSIMTFILVTIALNFFYFSAFKKR